MLSLGAAECRDELGISKGASRGRIFAWPVSTVGLRSRRAARRQRACSRASGKSGPLSGISHVFLKLEPLRAAAKCLRFKCTFATLRPFQAPATIVPCGVCVVMAKEWNRYQNIGKYWLLGDMSIAARPIRPYDTTFEWRDIGCNISRYIGLAS